VARIRRNVDSSTLDAQRIAHLRRMRAIHRRNLDQLEEQAAIYGGAVPLILANQLAETRESLRAIDGVLASPVPASVLADLGIEGQMQIVMAELRQVKAARSTHDALDETVRGERQEQLDTWFRRIWYAIIVLAVLVGLHIVVTLLR
jgi:hypothetical protein